MADIHYPIRLLVGPTDPAYVPITERLMQAVADEPETFDIHVGEPGVEDHVGYHSPTLAATVWAHEPHSVFMRLTVRPALHPVFAELFELATRHEN